MTDDDAKAWVKGHFGTTGLAAMQQIVDAVTIENATQNLVAPSTLDHIWSRHVVDSAQLLFLAKPVQPGDLWVDIGSGAGFPGLVIAALSACTVILLEPRKRRATFLAEMIARLEIEARATVDCRKVQNLSGAAAFISARAVAPIDSILSWSAGCSNKQTHWLLPKGRSANDEVASLPEKWHGVFHVERSITDAASMIVIASGVARR